MTLKTHVMNNSCGQASTPWWSTRVVHPTSLTFCGAFRITFQRRDQLFVSSRPISSLVEYIILKLIFSNADTNILKRPEHYFPMPRTFADAEINFFPQRKYENYLSLRYIYITLKKLNRRDSFYDQIFQTWWQRPRTLQDWKRSMQQLMFSLILLCGFFAAHRVRGVRAPPVHQMRSPPEKQSTSKYFLISSRVGERWQPGSP